MPPFPPEVVELGEKVKNWGRWGHDDEIGTLNLVTDDVVKAGAAEIKSGKRFSLAIGLDEDGPQIGATPGRENAVREMIIVNEGWPPGDTSGVCFNDDKATLGLQASTHWDALSHTSYGGHLYNGYPANTVTAAGASKLGIDKVRSIAGRAVLLDVARARGEHALTARYAITGDDLDAAAELAKVNVESGDVVLVRTGKITQLLAGDRDGYNAADPGHPGLSLKSVEWFREHDVAAAATDNYAFEVFPGDPPEVVLPVHVMHLVFMGMTQGQNWNFEDLARDCADDGRYTMFLAANPEPFTHGVGSPVNPVVVK
jgi:kynurenine formamidase